MIAPASPADPRPDVDALVEYRVDLDAAPGARGPRPGAAADRNAPQTQGRGT